MFGAAQILKVSDEVKEAVSGAAEASVRAVKISVDKETLVVAGTVPETESLEADFNKIQELLEDDKPCLVVARLKGSEHHQETDWALISYGPDNAPVKLRMMNANSMKPIKEALSLSFLEYQITMKDEVTLAGFTEATHVMSEQERRDVMSREERQIADVKKEQLKEQAAAPKMLAGLVALKVKVQESFEEAMKAFMESENKAVVATLTGEKSEELSGKVLDDIATPSALKGGKLPNDTSCFILVKKEAPKILFLTWQPEDVPIKLRMKSSTFKASTMDVVKEMLPDAEILTANATEEDDINDEMGNPRKVTEEEVAPQSTGGYKPSGVPVGGVRMPGMGGPMC
jgi:hypothetical protein